MPPLLQRGDLRVGDQRCSTLLYRPNRLRNSFDALLGAEVRVASIANCASYVVLMLRLPEIYCLHGGDQFFRLACQDFAEAAEFLRPLPNL